MLDHIVTRLTVAKTLQTSLSPMVSWTSFNNTEADPAQVVAFEQALKALDAFKDAFAQAAPDATVLEELANDLDRWTQILGPAAQPELARLSGRMLHLPARGHAALPRFSMDASEPDRIRTTMTFGPYHLGGGGAAHGGAIMMVFDEVMGAQVAVSGGRLGRTANLTVEFRALVPIGAEVHMTTWVEQADGRKRYVRGELWHGETLCAEANALFIELTKL
jgi:acyl-coenzyme A thioesterase PaaI-like protein